MFRHLSAAHPDSKRLTPIASDRSAEPVPRRWRKGGRMATKYHQAQNKPAFDLSQSCYAITFAEVTSPFTDLNSVPMCLQSQNSYTLECS